MARARKPDVRAAQAVELARQGLNRSQISAAVGGTWPSVNRWLKAAGVVAVDGVSANTKIDRNAAVREAYESGKKADDVAREFGVSPARICTILKRQGVVLRGRGGTPNGPKKPRPLTKPEKFLLLLGTEGLSLSDFLDLPQAHDALGKFRDQRMRAKQRHVPWTLTFGQWWGIWTRSGQWAKRGRLAGDSAVMARHGDDGPYSVGNVYITTLAKNFVDSHLFRGHRIRGEASHAAVLSSCPFEPLNTTQRI